MSTGWAALPLVAASGVARAVRVGGVGRCFGAGFVGVGSVGYSLLGLVDMLAVLSAGLLVNEVGGLVGPFLDLVAMLIDGVADLVLELTHAHDSPERMGVVTPYV